MKTSKQGPDNKKVAKSRGKAWREALVKGRLDSRLNPSQLALARVKAGLSQAYLAKAGDLSLGTYGGVERGVRPVKEEKAKLLASAVKVGFPNLFCRTAKGSSKYLAIKLV